MSQIYTSITTPLGAAILRSDGHVLTGLYFLGQRHMPSMTDWQHDPTLDIFTRASKQLLEYIHGKRQVFDLPYRFTDGTPFQQNVWRALVAIPYGKTVSYGDLARVLGSPQAARATGTAIGRNPLTILVPCHRVIGRDGSLTGYAGGLPRKKDLLALEQKRA